MILDDDVRLLQTIPLFARIEPNKLKLIAFTAERVLFKKEDIIFKKGDPGRTILIILEGEAKVVLISKKGSETFAKVRKGEVVGEIATLCDVPRTMTMVADSECVCLSLTKDLFLKLIREIPDLAEQIICDLARRMANTIHQFESKIEEKGGNDDA